MLAGPLHTAADEIHLPVKILKLLIAQLQYHLASVPVPVDVRMCSHPTLFVLQN